MKLTNKFLEIPTMLFSPAEQEKNETLGLERDMPKLPGRAKINPMHIVGYYATMDESEAEFIPENIIHTAVDMQGGHRYYVPLTIKEFEELLNSYSY